MPTKMTFEFLDVGMGDGTFIMMGNTDATMELAMVDFGVHRRTEFKIGTDDAMIYLTKTISRISKARKKPTPYLDHLFLTHPDHDHYNSVMPLIESAYPSYEGKKLTIGRLSYGGNPKLYKGKIDEISFFVEGKGFFDRNVDIIPSNACSTVNKDHSVDPYWWFHGGKIKVYLLSANYPKKESLVKNPLSLCLMFADENNKNKVIIMGDAEAHVEAQIIENFKEATKGFLNASALKLGHHASQAGTSEEWIEAVRPKAIFASGDFVWAHPYCNTIDRVINAKTLSTMWEHRYVCGKSHSRSEKEYFNNPTLLPICMNLWYVVKEEAGEMMKDEDDDSVAHATTGKTYGVQWELVCDGDTRTINKTDTSNPD